MNLIDKNIIIISPDSWGENFLSKHHYAIELIKRGNKVFFLNPPSNKFKKINNEYGITIIDYKSKYKGLRFFPKFASAILTRIEFKSLEKELEIKFDIIWIFDSSRFFNLAKIDNVFKIAHLVDLNEDFQRSLLCKSADICFTTSDIIASIIELDNKKVFKINHGYQLLKSKGEKIYDIKRNGKIKVGYIGNLNIKYLDWKLILKIAKENSDIDFYFIGNLDKNISVKTQSMNTDLDGVLGLDNCYFLGVKPAHIIPQYLSLFDALLVVYKAKEFRNQLSNPHKMMEYLGSGKVVIATYTDEYKDKENLIEMILENSDFSSRFKAVVDNLEFYNSKLKQKLRIDFAQKNTYNNQLNKIENYIKSIWRN